MLEHTIRTPVGRAVLECGLVPKALYSRPVLEVPGSKHNIRL